MGTRLNKVKRIHRSTVKQTQSKGGRSSADWDPGAKLIFISPVMKAARHFKVDEAKMGMMGDLKS